MVNFTFSFFPPSSESAGEPYFETLQATNVTLFQRNECIGQCESVNLRSATNISQQIKETFTQ